MSKLRSLIQKADIEATLLNEIIEELEALELKHHITEFKVERAIKDKKVVTNFLNTTIQDLEDKKSIVEAQALVLKEKLEELSAAYDEVEQFSYIASHDLKSPLLNIKNFTNLLEQEYKTQLDRKGQDFLHFIVNGVDRMELLISDLLKYSRIGKNTNQTAQVDINDVIGEVKVDLGELIHNSSTQINITKPLPILNIYKGPVKQLFQNLIENAIKFKSERPPIIQISSQFIQPDLCEFQVKDNGIGIKKEFQKKVFMPFQRLSNGFKTGTGIGLAICQKAVKMHNGEIYFQSDGQEGTTFVFTISQE